ncbi:LOW QUALITY PROTEIN: hypothetical protein HJFPF1_13051 [Paramyrothecium foliicola]|nr:LOW QUALITY PROTEIN: hypothetical protein HJFPF1_13051 [Paramyrothecium foliicola]
MEEHLSITSHILISFEKPVSLCSKPHSETMAFAQFSTPSTTWKLDQTTSTLPLEAGTISFDTCQKQSDPLVALTGIDLATLQTAGLYHSLVKIESRFENPKTGYSVWKTGNGWLIRPDFVVVASDIVYDAEYQLGAATQVKCYIGNKGLTSSENSQAQLHYGQRIVTSAEWIGGCEGRSRDIAFIQVAKPQSIEVGTYNAPAQETDETEISASPVTTVPVTEEKPAHCAGCGGTCGDLATTQVEQPAEPEPAAKPEETVPAPPAVPTIITEPDTDGFVSVSVNENTPVEQDDTELDPFYETLLAVSKIDTATLDIESPLLGSVGQFVSTVAGSLLRYVVGAETISSGKSHKVSGAAERALLAEASLQAVLAIEESPELDEIVETMRGIWNASAPQIDDVARLLAPYLTEPAVDITSFHEEDVIDQADGQKKPKRRALGIRHFPGSGINGSGNDFVKGLFGPTLSLPGREEVFSSVGPVLRSAILATEQVVSTAGQTEIAERAPKLLQKVAGSADSAPATESTDEKATRVLLQRAVMADAALQALSALSMEKLQSIKLIPLDAVLHQVEDIFDFLKMAIQRFGPTALLPSKHAVKKFAVLLMDPVSKPQAKVQPVEPVKIKSTTNRFALRDRLRANKVHDLGPRGNEVLDKLLLGVDATVNLSNGAELGVGAEDQVGAGSGPLLGLGLAVDTGPDLTGVVLLGPGKGGGQEVDEEVVGQLSLLLGQDTPRGAVEVGVQGAEAANKDRQLGRGEGEQGSLVDEEFFSASADATLAVVAEAIGGRFQEVEGTNVGLGLGGIHTAGSERNSDALESSVTGGLLDCCDAAKNNQVSKGDLAGATGVERLLNLLQGVDDLGELLGVVGLPAALGLKGNAGTVGTTTLSGSREQGVLQASNVCGVDNLTAAGRERVLPGELLLGYFGSEVARAGTEVTVKQLEPGLGKSIGQLVGVLEPAFADLAVLGVVDEGEIGGQHGGTVELGLVEGVGVVEGSIDSLPLLGAGRRLDEFPSVAQERLEEAVAPPEFGLTAGHLVGAVARTDAVAPAETHLADISGFRLRANNHELAAKVQFDRYCVIHTSCDCSMGLAKGVATDNQGSSLLVVHAHAVKSDADVVSGHEGVGVSIGALGVHRLLELVSSVHEVSATVVANIVTLGNESGLSTPVDALIGLPSVGTTTSKAKWLEVHAFEGDVAGENHQIGPRNFVSVLLLDRPCAWHYVAYRGGGEPCQGSGYRASCSEERSVVDPGETFINTQAAKTVSILTHHATTTAAVNSTVGTGAVPSHTDKESTIVAKVGRPPILRVVQRLESLGVVKVSTQRVILRRELAQDIELERAWPEVAAPSAATGRLASDPASGKIVRHGPGWDQISAGLALCEWAF